MRNSVQDFTYLFMKAAYSGGDVRAGPGPSGWKLGLRG